MRVRNKEKQHEYWIKHYRANKQKYIDKAKAYKQSIKDFIKELKEKTPCVDCNNNFPYYVMDFDHTNGDKEYNVANMFQNKGMLQVKKEVKKCDIVCSNCHRIRTHKRMAVE